jgi:hypothetical protein
MKLSDVDLPKMYPMTGSGTPAAIANNALPMAMDLSQKVSNGSYRLKYVVLNGLRPSSRRYTVFNGVVTAVLSA